MCLGLPGKIIRIDGKLGTVEMLGASREISLDFTADAKEGDYVLVHAGFAIQIIDEEEALKTIELFSELEELND